MISWIQKILGYNDNTQDNSSKQEAQLLNAATVGEMSIIRSLIESDISINCTDKQDSTPLHLAVKEGHLKCLELLLMHPEMQINKDRWGRTPIHTAVVWNKPDLLELILEQFEDSINISDNDGRTALHLACATSSLDMVQILLKYKANIDSIDQRKWTALMCSIAISDVKTCEYMLKNGANSDVPLKYNSGMTGLRLAIEKHDYEITELLLRYGATIEFTATFTQSTLSTMSVLRPRQMIITQNLATTAIENVSISQLQSIDIAMLVVRASPAPPDEDSCVKMYEQFVKPLRRVQRSMPRDVLQMLENLSESSVHKIMRLLQLGLATGVDLSKSNIDRLSRKFRLDKNQDTQFYAVIRALHDQTLTLHSVQSLRKQFGLAGNPNLLIALERADIPGFVRSMILLEDF